MSTLYIIFSVTNKRYLFKDTQGMKQSLILGKQGSLSKNKLLPRCLISKCLETGAKPLSGFMTWAQVFFLQIELEFLYRVQNWRTRSKERINNNLIHIGTKSKILTLCQLLINLPLLFLPDS